MDFLKGSLNQNQSIAIHEAIIERKQEDHTRISIILPYASLGDLSQFLVDGVSDITTPSTQFYNIQEKFPGVNEVGYELHRSLLKQCAQLADALKFLHEGFRTVADDWKVFCAHMDLKPANIIIFESHDGIVGKWKLCDFGISVFYAEQKGQRGEVVSIGDYFNSFLESTQRSPRRPPGAFQAPEVEFPANLDMGDVGEGPGASDIWSFGAIFAEVLAYASGRSASVKKFRQLRKQRTPARSNPDDFFYTWKPPKNVRQTSYHDCVLRSEVADWLNEFDMEVSPSSPPAACLKCWATCVKSILEVHPEKRPRAATLDHWILSLQKHTTKSGKTPCIATFPTRLYAEARSSISSVNDSLHSSMSTPYDGTYTSSSSENPPPQGRPSRPLFKKDVFTPTNWPNTSGLQDSPRGPSNGQSSQVTNFDLASPEVIDYDLDGHRTAFLGKNHFQVFKLSPRKHSMNFHEHGAVTLVDRDQKWKGISLSGDYLVVWGTVSNVPVLRVYNVSEDPKQLQCSGNLPNFDSRKRIAVSKQGYIAMINNNLIHVLKARDQTVYRRIEMPGQGKVRKFLGISFDDSGSFLYAWGNQDTIYGALFVYEFTKEIDPEVPTFDGKYQNDFNGQDVVIMPLQGQTECIIAVDSRYFMGCIDRDRRDFMLRRVSTQARQGLVERGLTPQHIFGPFNGPDTIAACVFDDSLILVQSNRSGRFLSSKNWTGQICQQPLDPHEMPDLTAQRPLASLRQRPKADPKAGLNMTVKVGVVRLNETDVFIIVCHKDGKVELVPLMQESQDPD
ncbi:hypothetical protein VMCG_02143 [Cytospora schulzeri]|uniref:non-specific serine/threonine protein kinase n=1 Tax=Cytospora schulzeri TaxID=448051 RepID=A0A423X3B7_9PEZI|nr:hypothetical protein VMCG_02143 [Valsa malicola]